MAFVLLVFKYTCRVLDNDVIDVPEMVPRKIDRATCSNPDGSFRAKPKFNI